jgi:hypothetical protein
MERRIDRSNLDLDQVADLITHRQTRWLALGITAEALTWMDNDADWPAPLLTDRNQARRPMSLGLHLLGDTSEAQFVVYAGGWVDVEYVAAVSGEVVTEHVELENAYDLAGLLDAVAANLTRKR